MSNPIFALRITEETLPMITVLNSGHRPWQSSIGDFYIFETDSPNTTTKHEIISEGTFRALQQIAEKNGTDITVLEVK